MPDVLVHDRLGHALPGTGGTYAHVSPPMRAELVEALQARRETALAARRRLSASSVVPVLAELLDA
ncbi:MAG TPA: hypothetical protein VHJ17_23250 [Thermomonospora sp.]|nr:hypothetical protein [Thermomonospora sp.]